MGRRRVYINPFNAAGNAYTGWVDVSDDTIEKSIGTVTRKLDLSDYDVGVFSNSNVSLRLKNAHGKYSDVDAVTSIFDYKRADSKVKITWDPAEYPLVAGFGMVGDVVSGETILFEGLLNDDSTVMRLNDQTISFQLLGYESILDRVLIDSTWAGSLPADNKASTMIKRILAIAAASTSAAVLTVDNARIVPAYDAVWNDITVFTNKTGREAINDILTAANSVLYMDGTTPVVSARTAGALAAFTFYGPASTLGPENISDIRDISVGLNRTINTVTWRTEENPPTVNLSSIDTDSVTRYGTRKKNVTLDGISTTATQQAIIDAIRTEFSSPKQELVLVTPMNVSTLGIKLLDRILIDYPLIPISPEFALYGSATYGVDSYALEVSTFVIDTASPYKVIGIDLDLQNNQISLNLRRL